MRGMPPLAAAICVQASSVNSNSLAPAALQPEGDIIGDLALA